MRVALLLVLVACSSKSGTHDGKLTCDDYGKRLLEVGKTDAELGESFQSDQGKAIVGKMVADCQREQWTQPELACIVAAKSIDDMTGCNIRKR